MILLYFCRVCHLVCFITNIYTLDDVLFVPLLINHYMWIFYDFWKMCHLVCFITNICTLDDLLFVPLVIVQAQTQVQVQAPEKPVGWARGSIINLSHMCLIISFDSWICPISNSTSTSMCTSTITSTCKSTSTLKTYGLGRSEH